MTDRVLSALRGLGLQVPPLATLEREDGFFALLPDLLVYQDEQGTRRVTLRDLTRIHSDAEGILRVETPAGTALTANLMGFEPGEVQGFFAGVRDATAQAKNLPAAPLPTAGGFKTFGSVPRSVVTPQATEVPQIKEVREMETRPGPPAAPVPELQGMTERPQPESPKPEQPRLEPPSSPEPAPPAPTKVALPKFGQARQSQGKPPQREPVQTTKSGVTVVSAAPAPAPVPVAAAPVVAPPVAAPVSPPVHQAAPPVAASPSPASPSPAPVTASPGGLTELGARAAAVRGLPSRLQVLAVVLGLAAIGLAYFQYQGGAPLNGLWTLIAGGVGSVALFVFAEVTRLIVTLAGAVARGGSGDASD